jgi:S1/P1 Nuclease
VTPKIRLASFYIATLILALSSARARAWGDEGHKIICEIAYRTVQPNTRDNIGKLILSDSTFKSFSDSCIFPDHPRIRAAEHFINLPRDSHGLTSDECPQADKCVLSAIIEDTKIIASKEASESDKLLALKSLGHWVGDIHQPLHVSFLDDLGGNKIKVSGECSGNLHAVWDDCLVLYAVGPDISEAVAELLAVITPEQSKRWIASQPKDWANESFAISETAATGYCVMRGSSCDPNAGFQKVDEQYLAANAAAVKEQLEKAGVRLAHLLDINLGN